MEKQIGPFTLYEKKPNDIRYGCLYTAEVNIPVPFNGKRTIRVFLPEGFDPSKKYPLLVMADGQNIVDKYTTAFGSWDIDVRQHELIEEGYKPFIVLGIDSSPGLVERGYEYSFPQLKIIYWEKATFPEREIVPYSHLFYEYVAKNLIPFVKQYFPISDDRKDIACGGSSMGGIFAISEIMLYPEVFGTALIFSPGFFLYDNKQIKEFIDANFDKLDSNNKLFLYSGNKGFEKKFLEDTKDIYNYFLQKGLDNKNVDLLVDLQAEHNEANWTKHFNEAVRYWQKS